MQIPHTWSSCLRDPRRPIYCTKYLDTGEHQVFPKAVLAYSLYSLPVCTSTFFSTSPGFTCFRAGFNFLAGFFVVATTVCVSFELIVDDGDEESGK